MASFSVMDPSIVASSHVAALESLSKNALAVGNMLKINAGDVLGLGSITKNALGVAGGLKINADHVLGFNSITKNALGVAAGLKINAGDVLGFNSITKNALDVAGGLKISAGHVSALNLVAKNTLDIVDAFKINAGHLSVLDTISKNALAVGTPRGLHIYQLDCLVRERQSPGELSILSPIEVALWAISDDLRRRWAGAVFALHPANPDAARHFCTSAREILTQLLHLGAPDSLLLKGSGRSETASEGRPTRKDRLRFLVQLKSSDVSSAEVSDVLELFNTLNGGVHGTAGRLSLAKLQEIKSQTERCINFILRFLT